MKTRWMLAASMTIALYWCALKEAKVAVNQTPEAVQRTVQSELVGAELEDIARKTVDGKTVYETDIIRNGHKWEVLIGEDGTVLHRLEEGAAEAATVTSAGGQTAASSRERFDINKADLITGDVYYFGEDVDNYKDGKIISQDSAWRAGLGGAMFGLMIPAKPTVGLKYYQEIAPKVAMDRVDVVSVDETA